MYICTHVYMYTCTCTYMHVYVYICIHAYMYTCMYVYMHIYIHYNKNNPKHLYFYFAFVFPPGRGDDLDITCMHLAQKSCTVQLLCLFCLLMSLLIFVAGFPLD